MIFELFDITNLVLLVSTVAFLVILVYSRRERYTNLPPGPKGLPFLGNIMLFQRSHKVDVDITELSKKYGNVMSFKLGPYRTFVLSSYDTIKEALIDKAHTFSDRPMWLTDERRHGGIIFNKNWSERRRFSLVSMRDFGLGKRSLESRMQEESSFLIQEIEKYNGEPVDMTKLLPFATANIICSIIIGSRYQYDDEGLTELTATLTKQVRKPGIAVLQRFVPLLRHLPVRMPEAAKSLMKHVSKWKAEHEESYDPDNIRDLVDLLIAESRNEGSTFEVNDLMFTTIELFAAGTETTSTTLSWALLYLLHYPEVQAKCQQEIQRELGNRIPEYADIKKMPYTNAFMNEVQRVGNIAPLAIWHAANSDTELGGYTIPKDSIIILNLRTSLRDEKYFDDPETFNPDRWINAEGKIMKNPAFIPFSTGKRVCLGEQLAKKEYFIFLTAMVQNFTFTMADVSNPPSLDGVRGGIRGPGNFKLRATKV